MKISYALLFAALAWAEKGRAQDPDAPPVEPCADEQGAVESCLEGEVTGGSSVCEECFIENTPDTESMNPADKVAALQGVIDGCSACASCAGQLKALMECQVVEMEEEPPVRAETE